MWTITESYHYGKPDLAAKGCSFLFFHFVSARNAYFSFDPFDMSYTRTHIVKVDNGAICYGVSPTAPYVYEHMNISAPNQGGMHVQAIAKFLLKILVIRNQSSVLLVVAL